MTDVFGHIRDIRIIPVIKLESAEQAVPLAQALQDGGISIAEITFRTEAAAAGISAIRKALPEMLVGAGTVINMEYARRAIEAGAQFIVSPGFNPPVVDYVSQSGVAMIPGIATPSEIELALCKGLTVLKFFPAEALGGTKMLTAFSGPFPHVEFIPTGGISAENASAYLQEKNVLAVGGSWMIKEDINLVTRLSREAVSLATRNFKQTL